MNKKFISAVICMAMIVSLFMYTGVFAAECKLVQTGDAEMTVTIKSSSDRISVSVFPDGKTYADMLKEDKTNYNDIIVYGNEFAVESGVEKTFKMDLSDCKAGAYTIVVSERGKASKFKFDFERKDLKRIAIAELNKTDDTTAIIQVLDKHVNDVGISDADYAKADKEVIAEYISNSDVVLKEDDEKTNNLFKSAATIGMLANGEVENIYTRIESFELSNTDLDGWYDADFVTEATQKDITDALNNEEFVDFEEFYDTFFEEYILAVIENADSYVNVKKVLDEFADGLGIDIDDMTVKKYAEIAGVEFDSIAELESKIDDLSNQKASSGGSGGGGRGGSGGSGILRADEIVTETAEKMNVDIFTDIDDVEWARESIVALAEKSIINGKSKELFCPNDNITRYEFAKIAVLAFVPGAEEAELNFNDISKDHWAYDYVSKAFGAGLITGRDENTFDGDGNITREEMAAILVRAANAGGIVISDYEDAKNYVFRDDAEIDDFAREAIYILKHDGVINGVDSDVFAPNENATRAQAAHMIYKLSQL